MRIINVICSVLALGFFAGCETEKEVRQDSQAKLQAEAKVSKADAEKTALAQVPNGTVKEAELEKEKGQLIWSLDVTIPDSKDIKEVNVDAITGKVLSVETETPEQQAKEKSEDAKKEKKDKD